MLPRIVIRVLADLAGLVVLSLRHRRFVGADINSVPLVADRNDPGHVPPGRKAFQWRGRRSSTKVKHWSSSLVFIRRWLGREWAAPNLLNRFVIHLLKRDMSTVVQSNHRFRFAYTARERALVPIERSLSKPSPVRTPDMNGHKWLHRVAALMLTSALVGCGGGGGGGGGEADGGTNLPNAAPAASFVMSPSSGRAPLSVALDASASRDPDGQIVSYSWNFADGSPVASGITTNHTFNSPGTYALALTVVDDRGSAAVSTQTVTVLEAPNAPPTAVFSATPETGIAPFGVALDASGSSDSDGQIASYSWDFGDGSAAGSGVQTSHSYVAPGTYTIRLTVADNLGATGFRTTTITASAPPANQLPTASFTASVTSGNAPLLVAFDASPSRDPDGSIASYQWTFGDSATATGPAAQHTFQSTGLFTVTLTVIDNRGGASTTTETIDVSAPVPQLRYSVTEISWPAGDVLGCEADFARYFYARRLNERGEAVGYSNCWVATGNVATPFLQRGFRAFAWTPATGAFSLPAFVDAANQTFARDINDLGTVVGWEQNTAPYVAPFWTLGGGVGEALSPPPECNSPFTGSIMADGINNSGEIVGRTSAGGCRVWLYRSSTGVQVTGPSGSARAINNNGIVVGSTGDCAAGSCAASWSPATAQLNVLGSGSLGVAWHINDANETVGHTEDSGAPLCAVGTTYRPTFWGSDGAEVILPTLSNTTHGIAFGINSAGDIVGQTEGPAVEPCEEEADLIRLATLWNDQTAYQLDTLLETSIGLHLEGATSINDKGEILANGYIVDEPLRPCPSIEYDQATGQEIYKPDLMCRVMRSFLLRPIAP